MERLKSIIITILISVVVLNIVHSHDISKAIAVLTSPIGVTGTITFSQNNCTAPLIMNITVSGMNPGWRGLHIHEKGDLSGGCDTFLQHYNPLNKSHGAPWDENRHFGDFGNIYVRRNGNVNRVIFDHVATLCGPFSIVGRGIVIHNGTDDLGRGDSPLSSTTGNSGSRAACGVIGIR